MNLRLLWLSKVIGFKRAKQLALEAIHIADLRTIEEPHTIIKDQKKKTKEIAIATWVKRCHQMQRFSLTYKIALTKPPDGRLHPAYLVRQEAVKFSRLTPCTLHRVTGHPFIGSCTQQFFPQHTAEQVGCPCGEPVQTIEHVLLNCSLYTAARRKHLTASGRPRSLA